MNVLLLLLSFNWFLDYPDYSDPVVARSGLVEFYGAIKGDLLFRYTRTDSGETIQVPFYIRAVPLDNFRFGATIPFVWQYPDQAPKRVGIGDIKFETTYQLVKGFGDFFSIGGEFSLPTTSDTLVPADDRLKLTPYLANAYVWKIFALFVDLGFDLPVYDFKAGEFVLKPEGVSYHCAAQVWPIHLLAVGVEYESTPKAFIPNLSVYISDNWNVSFGLVVPLTTPSTQTVIAGIRIRM